MPRPRSEDPAVPLTISLPISLVNRIKEEAAENHEGVSSWVRRLVERALDREDVYAQASKVDPWPGEEYPLGPSVVTEVKAATGVAEALTARPLAPCKHPLVKKLGRKCGACGRSVYDASGKLIPESTE